MPVHTKEISTMSLFAPPLTRHASKRAQQRGLPPLAHFSDRGHPFHADRGHRFTLMADGVQRMRVTGFIVSQVSAMAVKPTVLSTPARSAGVGNSAPKAMRG
jgi:hypothetical protein